MTLKKPYKTILSICSLLLIPALFNYTLASKRDTTIKTSGNPLFSHKYTADPAALVYKDKVYLYTGHDVPPPKGEGYVMHDWLVFSTEDMVTWTEHSVPLSVKELSCSMRQAFSPSLHVLELSLPYGK